MQLLRVFSHSYTSGIRETSYLYAPAGPQANFQPDKKTATRIEMLLTKYIRKTGYPVELGLYSENLAEVYAKPQLLGSQVKVRALYNMFKQGLISAKALLASISFEELNNLHFSGVIPDKAIPVLAQGSSGFPGAVTGRIVHTIPELLNETEPIWVLGKITNAETKLFSKAKAIVLTRSGATSHAAILAKNLMLPLIIGAPELAAQENNGKQVTLDGSSGKVFKGSAAIASLSDDKLLAEIRTICKQQLTIDVFTNAETTEDIKRALSLDAMGVGLCRTEHMFQEQERLECVKEILFAAAPAPKSYQKLLNYQQQDFEGIFSLLPGKKIVVRYLDAPLHEFGGEAEANPMLGFRGARMLVLKPEIIRIQTRAIYNALSSLQKNDTKLPQVILELPMVSDVNEVIFFKKVIQDEFLILSEVNSKLPQPDFAVMLETPRACLVVAELTKEVSYFSFGTNDLTQMSFGLSRDDTKAFLDDYIKAGIYVEDPFAELDPEIIKFIQQTIHNARKVNPKAEFSICGEQAAAQGTIALIKKLPVGYIKSISVSPGKLPGALFWAAKH